MRQVTSPRSSFREARLLAAVGALSDARAPRQAHVDDIVGLDYLLQHPSVLTAFAERSSEDWSRDAFPSTEEIESTEEAFLSWKRSVASASVAPMLGRLIARGLLDHSGSGFLAPSDQGRRTLIRLAPHLSRGGERLESLVREFASDPDETRRRLTQAVGSIGKR